MALGLIKIEFYFTDAESASVLRRSLLPKNIKRNKNIATGSLRQETNFEHPVVAVPGPREVGLFLSTHTNAPGDINKTDRACN